MTGIMLDRSSGVPLYRQIKVILRDEILTEVLPLDQAMTEEELIRRFNVSRAPIRQALKELTDEGFVYRERAKGTFPVRGAGKQVRRPDNVRTGGLIDYLRSEGLHPVSRVWDVERVPPPREQAERFSLAPDEQVLHISRLISVEDQPLAYGQVWLRSPSDFLPSPSALEETGSAFDLLEQRHGDVVARVEHEAWATPAEVDVAQLLEIDQGSPVLSVASQFYARDGHLLGWRINLHRSEQFKYRFTTTH